MGGEINKTVQTQEVLSDEIIREMRTNVSLPRLTCQITLPSILADDFGKAVFTQLALPTR